MRESLPNPGPQSAFDWLLCLALPGAFVVYLVWQVFEDYAPFKTFPLWFLASWLVQLPLHELGHALMARSFGWYVGQLVLGFGATWKRFQWGDTTVELRMIPLEGFVRAVPHNADHVRLKWALVYFAGPGIELLALLGIVLLVGFDTLTTRSDSLGMIALQAFSMAIVVSVFVNLVPHAAQTQNGMVPNDGLGIVQSFYLPESALLSGAGATYDPEREEWQEYDEADWWKRR